MYCRRGQLPCSVHIKTAGEDSVGTPASGKGKPIRGIAFAQGPGWSWWVMWKHGEFLCAPQGDLILGENSQWFRLYDVNCYIILYVIATMVALCHINVITVRIAQINEERVVMEPELSSACNNPTPRTIYPALKDCYGRWSPKSWTKWTQQIFQSPQTKGISVCIC